MKHLFWVLLLVPALVFSQNSASTAISRIDTTVSTSWVKLALPITDIPRSVFSVEIANNTAGTLYFTMKSDTATATASGTWVKSGKLVCVTTGAPATFLFEHAWVPWIWVKASVSSSIWVQVW
jgi:hypothetical protein